MKFKAKSEDCRYFMEPNKVTVCRHVKQINDYIGLRFLSYWSYLKFQWGRWKHHKDLHFISPINKKSKINIELSDLRLV